MQIVSIEKSISGAVIYRITLEDGGGHSVHSGTLKRLGLKTGIVVDVKALVGEIDRSESAEAREFAMRSLASRGRTASELKGILIRKGFDGRHAAAAVAWSQQNGLIDEDMLLEDTAEALLQRKGIYQVRQILQQRGFSKSDAERVLKEKAGEPEIYEQILKQAQRKKQQLEERYPDQWGRRLGSWMYGKGHDGELIRRVMKALKASESFEEE